ncbi:MAG: purine-nucleoside phosphorylase [Proteobacteria bacterium]|nr:purine-nucleoside phosphorylase [Pseudomonadota bacterium]
MINNEWQRVDNLAKSLGDTFGKAPDIAIVLGSGLGSVADRLTDRQTIHVSTLQDWRESTIEGHAGRLHKGKLGNTDVLLQQGRIHLYEGYSPAEVVRPVRAMITWGVNTVLLTNAAGGIDAAFKPGQLMIVEDHLNLTWMNPLIGLEDSARGPRFPDKTDLYDPKLRAIALQCAKQKDITLTRGIYAGVLGPSYETPAEVRMLRTMGATAVGMSTVHEAIAARHLGARIACISCITNYAAGLEGALLNHDHVKRVGEKATHDMTRLITAFITTIGDED